MVQINLDSRISSDEVRPEQVALDSRRQKDPVRISDNYVLLNYVSRIRGTGKTDAEVRPLRCKAIST